MTRHPEWRYFFGRPLPTDAAALEGLAQRLDVSLIGIAVSGGGITGVDTALLQQRIRDAIRFRRDGWLWLVAILSALASVRSAAAAATAVLRHP